MSERIAVLSDTHGNYDAVRAAAPLLRALKPSRIFFLGDGIVDLAPLKELLPACPPIAEVCGNVDPQVGPSLRVEEVGGLRVLLTHGHKYGVKDGKGPLLEAAKAMECAVALYGHTHVPDVERSEGVLLACPGSLGRPFDNVPRFALLSVEDGRAEFYLMKL